MWWWIIGIVVAAVIVLLAPFIPHSRNPPSKAEQAGDWLDTARSIVAGLFGHR